MARVNITIPDELLVRSRAAGLNVSAAAASGLAVELDRRARRDDLTRYLAELEDSLGPIPAAEAEAARRWADAAFGPAPAGAAGSEPAAPVREPGAA